MTKGAEPMNVRVERRAAADFSADVDVAIVGAGAAGLVAALKAAEAGVSVLLVERDAVPAGSTALSAGLVPAAGTRFQRALGIADAPALFAADILRKAHDQPDAQAVARLTSTIGPVVEWLADRHGLGFSVISDFSYPGHSARRMHGLPSRSGAELMDRLRAAVEAAGIDIVSNARVDTLFHDPAGPMTGIGLVRPDGSRDMVGARAVILACNGYGGNPALIARHVPEIAGALYFGHAGNQGEAILWGEALGAAMRHLSGYQGHGSVAHPHGILITWATITEGGFQVTPAGHRFHNEARGYSEAAASLVAAGGLAFSLFDARIAGIARQFEDFRNAEAQGAILSGESIEALAAAAKLPAEALASTFAEVEGLKRSGGSDRFGRDFAGVAPLAPPFRAVKVTAALFHTQGGLVVDGDGAVLRPDGTRIPGLFAAGGAACGVSGNDASGYLSGNGLLTAIGYGAIAGAAAATQASSQISRIVSR